MAQFARQEIDKTLGASAAPDGLVENCVEFGATAKPAQEDVG